MSQAINTSKYSLSLYRWLFLFCLTTASMFGMEAALAQNLIIEQAFWEDKTGQADYAQARTENYTPYDEVLNRGYTSSTTWLRVRLRHISAVGSVKTSYIVLRVQPNFLDQVRLFDPLDPHDAPRMVGDRFAFSDQEHKSTSYGYILPASTQDRDVWLQLKTTSVSKIKVDAFDEAQMRMEDQSDLIVRIFCIGLLVFYLLVVFFRWAFERERLYFILLLRTSVLVLLLVLQYGFLRVWLDPWVAPEVLDWAFSFLAISATLMSFMFELSILRGYRLKRWANRLVVAMYVLFGLSFFLFFIGQTQHALWLNACLVGVAGIFFLMISLAGLQGRYAQAHNATIHLNRYWLSLYYFCLCVLLLGGQFFVFGWYSSKSILTPVLHYALFSSTMLIFIIEFRAWEIRKSLQQTQLNLLSAIVRAQQERVRREEQGNLLNMLMHEIRNPLAVIEAAQHTPSSKGVVSKNIGVIRHVLSHMLKLEQLSDDQLQLEKIDFLLSDCLVQVIDDMDIDARLLVLTGLDEDMLVHTDPNCLRVILANLLGNAFKYGSPGMPVELVVMYETELDCWGVAVVNRVGQAGVPDATRVFDKYYRGVAAKSLPGTGMGLYLVQQLTQRLGGTCRCMLEANQVRFELWLPTNEDKSFASEMI